MHYICSEVEAARAAGVLVEGVCLYPVADYAGWEDDRACAVGLLSQPGRDGERSVYEPLVREMQRWRPAFERTIKAEASA
jgi:hypothetical protein